MTHSLQPISAILYPFNASLIACVYQQKSLYERLDFSICTLNVLILCINWFVRFRIKS